MRCQFCGSTGLHRDKQHKNFSVGKAAAGAVVFGTVGAAAGFIGKDQEGYRCGACGSFMDAPMDSFTEMQVDSAIRDAEAGRSRTLYDYYKRQYPNIQATVPEVRGIPAPESAPALSAPIPLEARGSQLKRSYAPGVWEPDCPVWVETVILKTDEGGDKLSLVAWNQSGRAIRSVYFDVQVLDDTGDEVSRVRCVYQNLSVPGTPGDEARLPLDKEFDLKTDLAYRVELRCEKVAFDGDEVWRAPEEPTRVALPGQALLTARNFPRIKYVRTRHARSFRDPQQLRLWMPLEGENFWLCDCGHPAGKGQPCPYCGDRWEQVEPAFDQQTLRQLQQTAAKQRAARRAEKMEAKRAQILEEQRKAEEKVKDKQYAAAAALQKEDSVESLEKAAAGFRSLRDWRDAKQRAEACTQRAEELKEQARVRAEEEKKAAELRAKKNKKIGIILGAVAAAAIALVLLITQVIQPGSAYRAAEQSLAAGQYDQAIEQFGALAEKNYKDSADRQTQARLAKVEAENRAKYEQAMGLLEAGDYDAAEALFRELGTYEDSVARRDEAIALREEALRQAELERMKGVYEQAESLEKAGKIYEAATTFYTIKDYEDAWERCFELWGQLTTRETLVTYYAHTAAITKSGGVVATGRNDSGQCNVNRWTDIVALAVTYHTVGLKKDGTVVATGPNEQGQCDVEQWQDIVAIAAAERYTLGLKADGTVVSTRFGPAGLKEWTDVVDIVAGGATFAAGLTKDGTVLNVDGDRGMAQEIEKWQDIRAIRMRAWSLVGFKADGSFVSTPKQLSFETDRKIVDIGTGQGFAVALLDDGTAALFGQCQYADIVIEDWSNLKSIHVGAFQVIGVTNDGQLLTTGLNSHHALEISGWKDLKVME